MNKFFRGTGLCAVMLLTVVLLVACGSPAKSYDKMKTEIENKGYVITEWTETQKSVFETQCVVAVTSAFLATKGTEKAIIILLESKQEYSAAIVNFLLSFHLDGYTTPELGGFSSTFDKRFVMISTDQTGESDACKIFNKNK